jgi:hypothetical protein
MNINYNGAASSGDRISDFGAGEAFVFETARNSDNNGLCVRVKDSKAGKARFVNLETGKLLTASAGDVGRPADVEVDVIV